MMPGPIWACTTRCIAVSDAYPVDATHPARGGELSLSEVLLGTVCEQVLQLPLGRLRCGGGGLDPPELAVMVPGAGGHEIGQRTFDEEGVLLPETVYAWPGITTLTGGHTRRL